MKLAGIAGKGRGKLGSMIYKSVAGEQIVSQYQPSVSNPNSTAQVEQRARFKLMSQVAAAVSSCIAIPKNGMQSSRNLFVKKNMSLVGASEGIVNLDYQALQFTAGTVALPAIGAARAAGKITVSLSSSATVNRVVYLVFVKTAENSLRYVESVIQTVAGEDGDFPTEFNDPTGDVVIYAYGMKDKNSKATAAYENYTVQTGTALASLILNRKLSNSSYQITATSGVTLFGSSSDTETQSLKSITFSGVNNGVAFFNTVLGTSGSLSGLPANGEDVKISMTMNSAIPNGAQLSMTMASEGVTDNFTITHNPGSNTVVATSFADGSMIQVDDMPGDTTVFTLTIDGTAYTFTGSI